LIALFALIFGDIWTKKTDILATTLLICGMAKRCLVLTDGNRYKTCWNCIVRAAAATMVNPCFQAMPGTMLLIAGEIKEPRIFLEVYSRNIDRNDYLCFNIAYLALLLPMAETQEQHLFLIAGCMFAKMIELERLWQV
jgi:hypothetical protein